MMRSHKDTRTSVSFALSHVLALKEASSRAVSFPMARPTQQGTEGVLWPTATWLSVETVPPSVEPSDDCGPFPSGLLLGSPLSSTGNWSSWRANMAEPSATKWTEAHLPSVPPPASCSLCQKALSAFAEMLVLFASSPSHRTRMWSTEGDQNLE